MKVPIQHYPGPLNKSSISLAEANANHEHYTCTYSVPVPISKLSLFPISLLVAVYRSMGIYLDTVNIFIRILALLAGSSGNRRR